METNTNTNTVDREALLSDCVPGPAPLTSNYEFIARACFTAGRTPAEMLCQLWRAHGFADGPAHVALDAWESLNNDASACALRAEAIRA